jgi:hypothetical protein
MTVLRIWFDLAEADIVLNDQRAVRKSMAKAFSLTFTNLGRLLANYLVTTIIAAVILLGGLWTWLRFVRPESVMGAFWVGQFTLLLLLIPRFWQRGVAVAYWKQKMMLPVVPLQPVTPLPIAYQPAAPQPIVSQPPPGAALESAPPAPPNPES